MNQSNEEQSGMGWKRNLLTSSLILVVAGGLVILIFSTEPVATREGATRETAMLVEVVEARKGSYRPYIIATGTVRPSQEITLRPRVSGEVIDRAAEFVPGGIVRKGEILLRLDPADFRNALEQRRNELARARAELRMEQGRQRVAEQEYRLLDQQLTGERKALALREPQLEAARARVDTARTQLAQAQLELERTTINAPFDAHVLSREVDVGSQVAVGDALARLVGADTYWVETTVPVSKVRWLALPSDGDEVSKVQIRNRSAWPPGVYREGRLFKLVGTLDDTTRMARLLVVVDDPLARHARDDRTPQLMLGSYVEVGIRGRLLTDVVRLDRQHVRQNNTVWVMSDDKLEIRDAEIILSDSKYAYIRNGVKSAERVVVSDLATVSEGAPLRLNGSNRSGDNGNAGGDSGA